MGNKEYELDKHSDECKPQLFYLDSAPVERSKHMMEQPEIWN